MAKLKIPEKIIRIVDAIYSNATLVAREGRQLSAPLTQKRGVTQGDPASPVLFIVALDRLLADVEWEGKRPATQYEPKAAKRLITASI